MSTPETENKYLKAKLARMEEALHNIRKFKDDEIALLYQELTRFGDLESEYIKWADSNRSSMFEAIERAREATLKLDVVEKELAALRKTYEVTDSKLNYWFMKHGNLEIQFNKIPYFIKKLFGVSNE